MSTYYSPKIITDGLVMCLDIGNIKSYPASGTTITDRTGTYTQTATSAAYGIVDGVACLDCTAGGYTIVSGTGYTFGNTWTMISWARVISSTATWRTLWRTIPDDHPILIETGANRIGYYDNNAAGFIASGLDVSTLGLANKWAMYSIVQTSASPANINFYINGLAAKGSVAASCTGNRHEAWGNVNGGSQPFGYISVALLYNRNLSEAEILQVYDATKGRHGK